MADTHLTPIRYEAPEITQQPCSQGVQSEEGEGTKPSYYPGVRGDITQSVRAPGRKNLILQESGEEGTKTEGVKKTVTELEMWGLEDEGRFSFPGRKRGGIPDREHNIMSKSRGDAGCRVG